MISDGNGVELAWLKRDPETGEAARRILGLPDDMWTDMKIEVGVETVATATVTLILRADQLVALAELAAR